MERRRKQPNTFWDDIVQQQRSSRTTRIQSSLIDNFDVSVPHCGTSSDGYGSRAKQTISDPIYSEEVFLGCCNHVLDMVAQEEENGEVHYLVHRNHNGTANISDDDAAIPDGEVSLPLIDETADTGELDLAYEIQPFVNNEGSIPAADTEDVLSTQPSRSGISNSSQQHHDLSKLDEIMSFWEDEFMLTDVAAVVGSVRYTVEQYNFTRAILEEETSGRTLPPHYKTQRCFQSLITHCLPFSRILSIPKVNVQHQSPTTTDSRQTEEHVRVFLPSSWAKLDVETPITFDQMFPRFLYGSTEHELRGLESSVIVQRRPEVTSPCENLFALHNNHYVPCNIGDIFVNYNRRRSAKSGRELRNILI